METSIHSTSDAEEKEDSCYADEDDDDDDVYLVKDDDDDDDDIYQEFEELDFFQLPDNKSIVSDDSFYPTDNSVSSQRSPTPEGPEPRTFFMACCSNNAVIAKIMIRQGVSEEEVREVDKNNRTGLIVACYQGYVDIVIALSQCPYVDVNWQDSEGNTALMTAAQAGHIMITNFLLNYFAGVDIELRNCHGFTAIMKAAMQGRANCVRALMMSGADIEVRDYGRKLTPLEWALFTGHYETARMMQRLMARPCAEQFCDSFRMEWPKLSQLVCQAQEPRPCWRQLSERMCGTFNLRMRMEPLEEGVLDYMVRLTTALASPLVATACSTVCPGSPPCVGKHRPAVPDILRDNDKPVEDLKSLENYKRLFQNGRMPLVFKEQEQCARLQVPTLPDVVLASSMTLRRNSLLLLPMICRRSVYPGLVVPRVCLCKAPPPTYTPERNQCRSKDPQYLQVPKWKYKALKEEKEQEKQNNKLRFPIVKKR
ncbi:ankyrin repeat domain-containing protein 33B [Pangasianodon hypophthalmus]|uniref:ankyrin repeat domain-containing protein 33B n=1 Tax=Pangasianodon hypophthalmus TaxID=310915 RepID=UPI002307FFDA|nr:ankyrin repeat domain-containing protein 33B [Pangasianodon hypophthalmus]